MMRCCEGTTAVVSNDAHGLSWAVVCADCDRVLSVVDGPRDEVYACL